MLAYVYGVVPLSLCRNGGCGGSDQPSEVYGEDEDDEIHKGRRIWNLGML